FDVHKLIQTKQHLAKIGHGQLARVRLFARSIRVFLRSEKIESRSTLGIVGRAANRRLVTLSNRIRRRTFKRENQSLRKVMRIPTDVRIVEEREGLWSDRRARSTAEADQWLRLIEELHHRHQLAPLHHEVNASPCVSLVEGAGTKHRGIKRAADGQHAVADHL